MLRPLLLLAATAALLLGAASTAQAQLSVNDVSMSEGTAGTTSFQFSVTLAAPAGPGGVTFDIATADGTATAPSDYTTAMLSGQSIPTGSTGPYNFTVLVNGNSTVEPDETFFVNVTNVTGATVADGQGQGTITNDDVPVADVGVDASATPLTPRAGDQVTLTTTLTNTGPDAATGAEVVTAMPAGTRFQSLSVPGGWSCTTPAVGATGAIVCTSAVFAGPTATFTLVVAIAPGTIGGTPRSLTPTFTSTSIDPDPSDDADTATVTVAPTADVALDLTGPASVTAGQPLTLTATVDSDGPDPADDAELELVVPAGATFTSLTAPLGWSCTTPSVGATGTVTCTSAIALVGTETFTLVLRATGAAGTSLVTSGTVSATSFDPDTTNDAATATTTIVATPVVEPPRDEQRPPAPDPLRPAAIAPPALAPPVPFACGRIPTLTGRTVRGAQKILARDGCRVRLVSVRRGRARKGFRRVRIVAQSLKPGTPVAADGTLTVTRGPIRDPRR